MHIYIYIYVHIYIYIYTHTNISWHTRIMGAALVRGPDPPSRLDTCKRSTTTTTTTTTYSIYRYTIE